MTSSFEEERYRDFLANKIGEAILELADIRAKIKLMSGYPMRYDDPLILTANEMEEYIRDMEREILVREK